MTIVCGVSGTLGQEVGPDEVQRRQGSLFSVSSDLTVTKHLDQVTIAVCHLSVCHLYLPVGLIPVQHWEKLFVLLLISSTFDRTCFCFFN